MKAKRDARIDNDALKAQRTSKRDVSRKYSPALVPEPEQLKPIMILANLLPLKYRQPYWARQRERRESEKRLCPYYLDPTWKYQTSEGVLTEFYRLRDALSVLPLMLQAFVLQDDNGEVYEIDGKIHPTSTRSDLQIERNFDLLWLEEQQLRTVVEEELTRIEEAIEKVKKGRITAFESLKTKVKLRGKEFGFVDADVLVSSAHQRLIYAMAVQETMSCLTHPNAWYELMHHRHWSRVSDAIQAEIYIGKEDENKGQIVVRAPVLYAKLAGIEAHRIRECPSCHKFFWAGRKDKFGCSDCLPALRASRYREKYRTDYSRQRSAQRQAKAQQSELEQKSRTSARKIRLA